MMNLMNLFCVMYGLYLCFALCVLCFMFYVLCVCVLCGLLMACVFISFGLACFLSFYYFISFSGVSGYNMDWIWRRGFGWTWIESYIPWDDSICNNLFNIISFKDISFVNYYYFLCRVSALVQFSI
ncbi:uncharacterized protein EURHEDRAFT_277098 [Aspergillus ruber CBS 135680]|uniref:Uncharacterized protein n=1 Tax=Aspergillus ruber (strain CBS 135680) TaxID=1388766 RepID=A0A017S307_ASPRC|nr:uncharacterized protein EURHEDRAFT_277098 [Aspergillus ruber CBS 135680]EYE91014.1 hypothetical protein EURHEDRAFT_277098 [Aspergillus ruber CBS 135680]